MRRTAAALWSLAILTACSVPGNGLPKLNLPLSPDKWVHVGLFLVFGWLWLRAGARAGAVLAWGVAFAAATEVWQGAVIPGRSGDPFDALADAAGLVLAVGLWRWRASNVPAGAGS